jgi:hypothetical protein
MALRLLTRACSHRRDLSLHVCVCPLCRVMLTSCLRHARRYRNQDGEAVVSDSALFTRNTVACPNKLKPRYTAPTAASGKLGLDLGKAGLPGLSGLNIPVPGANIAQIQNNPMVQAVNNHITAATSAINALP